MAKKEGRISLPRLIRETEEKQERNQLVFFFAIIAALIIFVGVLIIFNRPAPAPAPAYEFKSGVNHPQELSDLIGHGTVVLLITENNCPPCDNMTSKMTDLQSQYKGTNATFRTFNVDDNATSRNIANNYGIQWVPEVFVIRSDGAAANFTGGYTNINTVKSAIEDAQNWQK